MQIGSLVECIDDTNQNSSSILTMVNGPLVKREIYTVIGMVQNEKGLVLEEKPLIAPKGYLPPGHKIQRFKEIQPPMDISELIEESIYALREEARV